MPGNLSGPGLGMPYPTTLFPSQLQNAPADTGTNQLALSPGDSFVVPAGDYSIGLGMYLVLQFLDPITNTWFTPAGSAWNRGMIFLSSDGFNVRIANLTGCVISASIINGGTGYVQATTTITAIGAFITGGAAPTILPIVGGAIGLTGTFTVDVPTKGAGYGVAPIVIIPPPPPSFANANGVGGIQAAAIAVLGASGSIASISIINPGAGYPTAPIGVIVPSPFDPNLSVGITNASVAFSLTSSGVIMGALVTNNGAPLPNGSLGSITLSVGGAGTSGSLTANVLQTIVSGSISGSLVGFGTAGVQLQTFGGAPLAGTITNGPMANFLTFEPRPANAAILGASLSVGAAATIYDGGLFESAPTFNLVGNVAGSTAPTLAMVMGGRTDIAIIQPGP
jgi:hypothetical protein